ncbi:AEC family transporter [Rhodoblastus sp. 17X3]|uniref:AEC family transporter n=1 Tax=Rhodoblastus sp. 17X3 TaxID=3047026 RepID=UPI0024B63DF0|nr:AEC family transporter [Rhodoblastus sp. 17X3]MDI9848756.1 AEC family transporter [Rhodoblastus sp. 17X3]
MGVTLLASLAGIAAPVMLVTGAGYVWRWRGLPFDHEFVTRIVTRLGAPALVFVTLSKTQFALSDLWRMGGASLACLILFALIAAPALRLAGLSQRVYLPSLVFPNIGNMGLPICLFAFGQRGLALAMIYFTVTTIGQFSFGPAIARGKVTLGGLFRAPFLYAAIVAVVCAQIGFVGPKWLTDTLTMVGNVTIPLMLLGLGAALAEFRATNKARQTVLALSRIGMGVAGGAFVAWLFGMSGIERGVLIVQSSMPVAVFNYLFARMYGADPDEVAGLVLLSTLASYVTLPLVVAFAMS